MRCHPPPSGEVMRGYQDPAGSMLWMVVGTMVVVGGVCMVLLYMIYKWWFVYIPIFNGPATISDLAFLEQYGPVLNLGDLAQRDELFENSRIGRTSITPER
jgi:hypothetical protein